MLKFNCMLKAFVKSSLRTIITEITVSNRNNYRIWQLIYKPMLLTPAKVLLICSVMQSLYNSHLAFGFSVEIKEKVIIYCSLINIQYILIVRALV